SRFTTVVTALALVTLASGSLYFLLHRGEGVPVTASATFENSSLFAPKRIADGRLGTYWLLPNGTPGWVEVQIVPPRHLSRIRLLNSLNPPYNDRATREYTLEIHSGNGPSRVIEGSFDFSTSPKFVEHPVDIDAVDRIRFVVRSYYGA